MMRMRPAYVPEFDLFKFALSVAYSAFFVWVLLRLKRSAERPLVAWAVGVTMVWGLLTLFFWEYADSRNSYRPLVMEVTRQLPPGYTCLSSHSLGEPQRALFEYFAGIVTYREEVPSAKTRLRHPAGARHAANSMIRPHRRAGGGTQAVRTARGMAPT